MMHGMANQRRGAAAELGLRVREYVPGDEMSPGMAYLVRRLLENTSNESWLKAGFLDNADASKLLASPHNVQAPSETGTAAERHALSVAHPAVDDGRPFFTEPLRDFSRAEVRKAFAGAIERTRMQSVANDGTVQQARDAVALLARSFQQWRDVPVIERAAVLTRAADAMRARRDELCAVIIRESGKTWREADGDVCEAIDFCRYYAREAVPMFERKRLGRFVGELDEVFHQPCGVCAVISPWNFPLAICCGMTVAALVTGNTVLVKPAEQTPAIAKLLCDILWAAGAPRWALAFMPGQGETVGAALVRDHRVAPVALPGRKAVGLATVKAWSEVAEGQHIVKHVGVGGGAKKAQRNV